MTQINLQPCFAGIQSFTAILISGANAANFLQGQLTCNVLALTAHAAVLGACCDHKGRMLANFWVGRSNEEYFIFLPQNMCAGLIAHLQKFAVFSKVTISEQKDWVIFNYCGQSLPDLNFAECIHAQLPATDNQIQHHWFMGRPEAMVYIGQLLTSFATQTSEETMHYTWILARLVFLQPSTMNLFLPQMLELEKLGGVSFNKGCYVGQEVVARTQHLGQLKRHLQLLQWPLPPAPRVGESIHDAQGQPVGNVVAVSLNPHLSYHLLCVTQDHSASIELFINNQLVNQIE